MNEITWEGSKFAWENFTEDVFDFVIDSGLSQNEVGRRAKVSKSMMTHLLKYNKMSIEGVLRLCDVMQVNIQDYVYV